MFDLPPFLLHLGNFLFSFSGLFLLSLFIFSLPSNTAFVSRTPKWLVRDPTGIIAGSLTSSYLQFSTQAQSSPAKLTLTGVHLPATISTAATTVRFFWSLVVNRHQEQTICSVKLRQINPPSSLSFS
jgi:hypothetical protein